MRKEADDGNSKRKKSRRFRVGGGMVSENEKWNRLDEYPLLPVQAGRTGTGTASANTAPGVHTGAPPSSPVKTRLAQLPKPDVHFEVKWRRRSSSCSDPQQRKPLSPK
ncbi:unnamed protein product [Rangifer tarandus platyrhynchus]|uniref:Uncharacterized protein n=1 Tax=Rangifer tarandus platyrhynchus TaxID=3082113 RepID=A0ABN9A3K5_RANTA|nr:unnamed protein product [Rangifer tarandus platyrhynchus]